MYMEKKKNDFQVIFFPELQQIFMTNIAFVTINGLLILQ